MTLGMCDWLLLQTNGNDVAMNGAAFTFSSQAAVTLPSGFITTSDTESVSMVFAEFEASSSLFPFHDEGSQLSVASSVIGFSIAEPSAVNLTRNITIELVIPTVSWLQLNYCC